MDHRAHSRKRVPEKLIQIRETLGLSQRAMAERIGLEVHYSNISKYERNESVPPLDVVLAYARAGRVPMESIIDDQLELGEVLDFGNGSASSEAKTAG